jgi:signal transduction histidine kinase
VHELHPPAALVAENGRVRLSARELAIILAFWTSLAALSAVNRMVDPRGEGLRLIAPVGSIALPFVEAWIWAALTPLIFWLSSKASNDVSNRFVKVAVLVVVGLVVAVAVDVAMELARSQLLPFNPRRGGRGSPSPFRGVMGFRFLNQALVYGGVLAAGFAREYFRRDQVARVRSTQLEAQLAHARLDALRMQLNPHFLFNTLHAMSALVERDPSGVRKMIARLSDLLRQTLGTGPEEVPLREEMAFLQKYLDIMSVRFQGRLHVTTSMQPDTLDVAVPKFILQPIIENALEHGVSRSGDARIEISSRRDGDALVVSVRDEGQGLDASAPAGVGLANTRARLETLYGDRGSLRMNAAEVGGAPLGTAVEIRLPWGVRG